MKDRIGATSVAQLCTLPGGLRLRHPILATIETWSDGVVCARFPAAALYGEGGTDTLALDALGVAIAEFVQMVGGVFDEGGAIGGPLLRQWETVQAVLDGLDWNRLEEFARSLMGPPAVLAVQP